MSKTLNLADRLLAMGRNFQALGRHHDALRTLGRLAGLSDLTGPVAEEAQVRLGEIHLSRRQFQRARRHLTAALAHQPHSARYHYLLAGALAADDQCDPHRAAEHYRRSLQINPDQPSCLGELGLLALRLGQTDEALGYLRRAVELAPNDPVAVGQLVTGLQEADEPDEARQALLAARFRNPRDARFEKLWNEFQFRCLHDEQALQWQDRAAAEDNGDEPRLLPFVRPKRGATGARSGRRTVRCDASSPTPAPHTGRPAWLSDRRHA
jgi:tetratricopeptide (TPR) repeat protein